MGKQSVPVVSGGASPLLYCTQVALVLDSMPKAIRSAFDEEVDRRDAALAKRKQLGTYLGPGLKYHIRNLRDTGKSLHQIGAVELWRILTKYLPISDVQLREIDSLTLQQVTDYWATRVQALRGETSRIDDLHQQAA